MNETIHEKLAAIFQDTQTKYSTNPVLKNACENTKSSQKLYLAANKIEETDFDKNRFDEKAKVVVSKKRTFEAAEPYAKSGLKTAVLNFANAFHPGGGVVRGSSAQEESLCRCSTLYDSLVSPFMIENFYKKHSAFLDNLANDDVIFSPAVKVFKSDIRFPEILPENQWFDVDVLTSAAPNIRAGWNGVIEISDEKLSALHESRLRKILDVAAANKDDVVILGAFGCGAFKNPPKVVATVAKKVIADYEHAFKTIEFAVFCPPQDSTNFDVFNKILGTSF